jgi:hypothetical protein
MIRRDRPITEELRGLVRRFVDDERGVVIAAVLMVLAVTSALAVSLMSQGRTAFLQMRIESETIEARLILDSALERAIAALENPSDPMLIELRMLKPFSWVWHERSVTLDLDAESGKVDLNAGDPGLLRAVLREVLGETMAESALGRVLTARQTQRHIYSVSEILDTFSAISGQTNALFSVSTTLTGAEGLDPMLIESKVRKALAKDQGIEGTDKPVILSRVSPERPIYTLKARLILPQGSILERQVVVLITPDSTKAKIIQWRSAAPAPEQDIGS